MLDHGGIVQRGDGLRGDGAVIHVVVDDPEQFKLIAKGDQIEATVTKAIAVQATSAPAE
jgi:hypothetical protein